MTALIVVVPEADANAKIREVRLQYDSSAALGVPAHVTLLYPFAEGHEVDEQGLSDLLARHTAFEFVLDRLERWSDGIVWLHPEPSQPFEDLTKAIWQRWPDYPPYAGTVERVVPHLTVSDRSIQLELDLPIHSRADAVTLIEQASDGTWSNRGLFSLA